MGGTWLFVIVALLRARTASGPLQGNGRSCLAARAALLARPGTHGPALEQRSPREAAEGQGNRAVLRRAPAASASRVALRCRASRRPGIGRNLPAAWRARPRRRAAPRPPSRRGPRPAADGAVGA